MLKADLAEDRKASVQVASDEEANGDAYPVGGEDVSVNSILQGLRAIRTERRGFEPLVRLLLRGFSKAVLSTTQPPLRWGGEGTGPEAGGFARADGKS